MSLITRKPVFGFCDQVRLKPACSATEASLQFDAYQLLCLRGLLEDEAQI